jgi:glucose/arabinose dehydrogenase
MRPLGILICASLLGCASSTDSAAQRVKVDIDTTPGAGTAPREPALGGRLRVPAGFKVVEFAHLNHPRMMALGPDGAVYVSQPGPGRIVRFADTDGDGVADSEMVAAEGLNRPHGMAFHKGALYVAAADGVMRLTLGRDGRAVGEAVRVNRYSAGGAHWSRTVIFGPDSAMYVSLGSSCNLCEEREPDRAAVTRYDENGANGRLFSRGLRNAVGMAVNPMTNAIWVTQHERDNISPDHENLPPEEINILADGADYGWPYCHSDKVPSPEYNDPQRCAGTTSPVLKMQAHSAPMGIIFLDKATNFPDDYRGDALVAFHGSWNRDVPTGAKVVRIRVRDGKPVSYDDFVTGWQRENGSRWGRPVDLLVYKDGSVLISDDAGDAIYRVYR